MGSIEQSTSDLANLQLSERQTTPLVGITNELNPWQDEVGEFGSKHPDLRVSGSSVPTLLPDAPPELAPEIPLPDVRTQAVLDEFDPLAHREELAAREAWARSESHPPPAPIPVPQPDDSISDTVSPEPPPKDVPAVTYIGRTHSPAPSGGSETPRRESGSTFPSLAALARSFSIPSMARPRPVSIDTAKAVPSPTTISALAREQVQPPHDPETSSAVDRLHTPPGGSGTASPSLPGHPGQPKEPTFDFQKFLDQMKMKPAEPVAKYLRSFLSNFAKRTFTVSDQVKIINDFLNFIAVRMRETDIWRNASEAEFDNAMEGMEKLVMNRLYDFIFTPQVVKMIPPRPVTADDLERDRVLSQRIGLFGWIEEKHLDVPEGEGSKGFLMFGQQELLKINHYKAPRDKLICILNCCKVIFGLIRHLHKDEGADSFVPILIFMVLKANPENLLSNVEFINRFRNPAKLQSEAGYYLSSLMGAVSFIETMDHTSLSNITQEQFENNVEDAIQALPHFEPTASGPSTAGRPLVMSRPTTPIQSPRAGEESAQPLALPTPGQTLGEDARRLLQKTGDTISKPLSAIGRIFSEALEEAEGKLTNMRQDQQQYEHPQPHWGNPDQGGQYVPQTPIGAGEGGQQVGALQTPYKPRVRRMPSPNSMQPSSPSAPEDTPTRAPWNAAKTLNALTPTHGMSPRIQALAQPDFHSSQHISRTPTPNLDLAGIQTQIDQAHDKAFGAARETLLQIFPGVDREVVEWVLEANQGDLGKSIEGLLEMSSES